MLRRFLLLFLMACSGTTMAQHTKSEPSKATQKQSDPEIDYKQPGAPMPPLLLIPYYDSSVAENKRRQTMTNKDFDNGANLLVMMFNPTCSHCQDEAVQMGRNKDAFKRSKVLMLATSVMRPYIPDFVTITHADNFPFAQLGIDSTDFISNVFLYQSLPQINIYDGERKLIRAFAGEVSMDTLKKYIQ